MLLAALDIRRATRDADMLALGLASDNDNLRTVVVSESISRYLKNLISPYTS